MNEVVDFPKRPFDTGGSGGLGGPALFERVSASEKTFARIELKLERHDEAFQRIEDALKSLASDSKDFVKSETDLREKIAHIDGRLANMPTFWQTLAPMATVLFGITGLIFTASRLLRP